MVVSFNWQKIPFSNEFEMQAQAILIELAERLSKVETLKAAAISCLGEGSEDRWPTYSVFSGSAGIALFYGCLDVLLPHQGWDSFAHRQLAMGVQSIQKLISPPLGLLTGVAGIGAVACILSGNRDRYRHLVDGIDRSLFPRAEKLLEVLEGTVKAPQFVDVDCVSGLAGICRYALMRSSADSQRYIERSLMFFVRNRPVRGKQIYFHVDDSQKLSSLSEAYPRGYVDCGVAHGIAGILAILSIAAANGHEVPGLKDAIGAYADYLQECRCEGAFPSWPAAIDTISEPDVRTRCKDAWCYGTPGVCRSLWLAGTVLSERSYCDLAFEGIRGVCNRTPYERGISEPIICHGFAGLAHILSLFYAEQQEELLLQTITGLANSLVSMFSPLTLLGFQVRSIDGKMEDQPGFLEGAAGVGISLATLMCSHRPKWDSVLLLS